MACFLVPVTEAIVTTVAQKILKKSENNKVTDNSKISFSEHLSRLNKMLWGGSGLLAFEHLWHGEISPFFPFLTAANDPEDTVEMLHEMATSGSAMAVLVTVVWIGTVIVSNKLVGQKAGAAV
ncbi:MULTISPECIES: hypothetical protein [Ruminococcus]|uniref:Uncharacterized protein n=1 Tax=Ruminococcus albus (strain ATCC 27210 / DSM 20455 / JCM 14654 / NCDO 2250 / 7) TaxID=697329 RepID=E6UKH4_RUMA7|nr:MULTISPECIES: hypothetical protein [Ruminococcus]ADU24170.1 hypothetical protein Rumal_3735 [Ruminococcus albus 7 = DSM 20455]MCR5021274.1 hypothetical protein [Ruminococcus sp.]